MVGSDLLLALCWIPKFSYLGIKNTNYNSNFIHTINKNDSFFNVFSFFSFGSENKLWVQATGSGVFYKMMQLHDL